MTNVDPTRVRYDALVQIVAEQRQRGEQPLQAWLDEIERTKLEHPEWFPPPIPPPIPTPVPVVSPPKAAVPFRPGERKPVLLTEEMQPLVDEVLKTWGVRYCIFQAGGRLFEIQTDSSNNFKFLIAEPMAPRLLQVGPIRARVLASRECDFQKEKTTKDGTPFNESVLPPEWLGGAIVTGSSFANIPVIQGLVQAPTLRADGALICERGYDESTGIYLASDLQVSVPDVVTLEDAKTAVAKLLDLVCDFDFVNEAGRSVWLAGLLSLVARHTFRGPAPIFIVDASKRGSGKTSLVDIASIIATGAKTSRMFYTDDDVEMDKRITSLALAGEQIVLIDNIVGKLASPPLDAALTSDSYRGRVLGKTEMTQAMPMKIVWWATGNGLIIGADTARRALMARLEPPVDRPEDRVGPRPGETWKYPRIMNHVTENRVRLLSYALTVVKGYIQAGRPSMGLQPMGSFEEWSATIRSAIVWAGAADPCATVQDAREADLQDYALRVMVECWPVDEMQDITTSKLIEVADLPAFGADDKYKQWRDALLEWLPARGGAALPSARDLGYALRAIKGSIVGDFKIESGSHTKSGIPWRKIRVAGVPDPESKSIPSLMVVQ